MKSVPSQRIPGLDLLRAAAIVMVLLAHYPKIGTSLTTRVLNFGWAGVDLFFVLSGYLIGSQVIRPLAGRKEIGLGWFYFRRFCRTLPSYYVVLAAYYALPAEASPGANFLVFTQNFSAMHSFTPSWSLCVEEQFYLLFPILAGLSFQAAGERWRGWFVPALLTVALASRTLSWIAIRPDLLPEAQAADA
jgi:peptidoglycan/LPS O-acetylase OafA/YrhL